MAKLLKITGRIIGGTFEWLLILLIVIAFAIRTSRVQTFLAEVATDFLSKELHTELRIGKVDIYFFDRLALDDVFVRDLKGDTLASLGSIQVVLSSLNLATNKVTLSNISLEEGRVGVNRDTLTGDYNYEFIVDYFDSGSSKHKKKKPMQVTVRSLDIDHVDITYDDYRKSYSDFGMDYDHLGFRDVVLHAKDFRTEGKNFSFTLQKLSAREKCGIFLRRLQGSCKVGEKGIFLSNVEIYTSRSRIFASRLNFEMNGLQSVHTFEDSATFDVQIDSSRVNLTDVSYFAPALKGMYQSVSLTATLSQKVANLKISDIDLRAGERTILRGNLLLPNFDSLEGSYLKENIQYAYIDLGDVEGFRLPDRVKDHFIAFDPMVNRLGYFEVKRLDLEGYWSQFVLSGKQIRTDLGTVRLDNGLQFTELKEGGYGFERSANSNYDVYVDSFNLGKFIDEPILGKVNGSLFMSGVVGQKDVIRINKLDGEINSCGFNNYTYSNITVHEGSFIDNVFDAKIDINDPHLELAFDGSIDLNKGQHFDFMVDIPKADLGKLNITNNENTTLVTDLRIDMSGTDLSNYSGTVALQSFAYTENDKTIDIPTMDLRLTRGAAADVITITSEVADVNVEGKVNPNLIVQSLNNALSAPLSAYFHFEPIARKTTDNNFFDLTVDVKNASEVLSVFAPKLSVSSGTKVIVHYNAAKHEETVDITSGQIMYDSIIARNLVVNQSLLDGNVKAQIDAGYFALNDSLYVNAVNIAIDGTENSFNTVAKWNEGLPNPAQFVWKTTVGDNDRVDVVLRPSFFSVKNQLWEIMNSSQLVYNEKRMEIDHLVLERDVQFVAINGVLSDRPEDKLTININDLHLKDFSSFINTDMNLEGNVSGDVRIATPFTAFRADGDLTVSELVINKEKIGDVSMNGLWDNENARMVMSGDLKYLKNETFDFTGYYYPYKKENNIDFNLDFRGMDLQFANAFVDPKVVSEIRGKLKGDIHLTGKAEAPTIDGKLKLENGNVKIGLLGVSYKLSGPVNFNGEESAFYIDNMPLVDEEGHSAFLTASINHTEFKKWNCDIGLNIEDDFSNRTASGAPSKTDKFLVLNTGYEEGVIYYGRAYVTGTANIFVTEGNTEISVDVKTEKGTWIDLPMYGNSELEEGKFIHFAEKGDEHIDKPQLDLTGLDLNLNFNITPDAKVKLIFNDKTGDEISATGKGDLNIRLNNLNDILMTGKYAIVGKESVYNFVMGPIKQNFKIAEGGTITWTGNPYNANLDLKAYNPVKANLNEVTQDVIEGNGNASSGNQDVYCYMYITETLDEPLITLDIQAPNASESGKAILARIRSDKDELQKQFFSLLLFKKFAPLSGASTGGTGGIADVITNQINSILDGMSQDVKLRVAYDGDAVTGNKSYELGGQIALGQNNNIILKGSFGVANTTGAQTQTNLIGDMSLEYLINSDGSFRVNIFNESNDNSVIQDKTQGLFTQGVGFHYQEDFNTMKDFKLIQIFLDIFRDEKRVKIKKRRHEVSVDTDPDPNEQHQEDVPGSTPVAPPAEPPKVQGEPKPAEPAPGE